MNPRYMEPKKIYVCAEQFQKDLDYVYKYRDVVYDWFRLIDPKTGKPDFRFKAYIEDKLTECSVTYRYGKQVKTYALDKVAGEIRPEPIHGAVCYSKLVVMTEKEIPVTVQDSDMNEFGKVVRPFSASPFLWNNEKYDNKRTPNCISYDINSSYAYAMCQLMPDTSKPPMQKHIEDGEIGFDSDGNILPLGYFSFYVFKLMESPFKHFATYYYEKKKKTKGFAHQRAKDILNLAVGYLQRKNPYLRAAIVGYANERIKSFMDENSIYCNTDSLVSTKERPDLVLSDKMGDFKIEHKGDFAMIGMNYQWNNENPKYRGVPSKWFLDGYDLIKDGVPQNRNDYELALEGDYRLCIIDTRTGKRV